MKRKIILPLVIVLVIAVSIWGYFYYTQQIIPASFAKSFLSELESKGAYYVDNKYFFKKYEIQPYKSWEDYYSELKKVGVAKEIMFERWEKIYLRHIIDYIDNIYISPESPNPSFLSYDEFQKVYKKINFSEAKLDFIEKEGDVLTAYISFNINSSNHLTDFVLNGEKKFKLIALNGDLGWKIIGFALRLDQE